MVENTRPFVTKSDIQEIPKKKYLKKKYTTTATPQTKRVTLLDREALLKEQKRKIYTELNEWKNSAGLYTPQIINDRNVGPHRMNDGDALGNKDGKIHLQSNQSNEKLGAQLDLGDYDYKHFGSQSSDYGRAPGKFLSNYNVRSGATKKGDFEGNTSKYDDNKSEGMLENFKVSRRGDHHEGITGPVHTFQKTNKHAHFKWGVKHHVGHQYA